MMLLKMALLPFLVVVAISLQAPAQVTTLSGKTISTDDMQAFIRGSMDSFGLPGISLAIINNGKIVYHYAAGMASGTVRVDDQTIFEAAS